MPLIVGVAGGSGSGKTTVARNLIAALDPLRVALIEQDAYYRDRRDLTPDQRAGLNYDHPNSIDEELLLEHLRELRAGRGIEKPVYDFVQHLRRADTRLVQPQPCIVVEGILILTNPTIRELFDLRLFVDTDADLRFIRRLRRDTVERGRTVESVIAQWEATVRPMHLQFVEPSRRYADLIIPEGGENAAALDVILARLQSHLDTSQEPV